MNFSELFQLTSHQCAFSPNGQYLSSVNQYRLIIRSSKTLEIRHVFACIDTIDTIQWSFDSEFILAGLIKRHVVQIFSLENPDWKCKIDEGSGGLVHVHWTPDSRHILTTAQFHLRITVWSLKSKHVSYLKYPKKLSPKSYEFSLVKPYMALVERRNESLDHVSIFNYESDWSMIGHFQVKDLEDLQGISWSPHDDILCVWENCYEYKIVFYTIDGNCLNVYKPDNDRFMLGIRCTQWSPTGQVIVVGDYDEQITILSYLTYRRIREPFRLPERLTSENGYLILKEESSPSKYRIYNGTLQISPIKPNLDRANPRLGISTIEISHSSRYIAIINDTMPNLLFIFDFKPQFHLGYVLIQTYPIRSIQWQSNCDRLALCTHTNHLYIWSAQGASCINLPDELSKFHIDEIQWNKQSSSKASLVLIGQNSMCIGFVDDMIK